MKWNCRKNDRSQASMAFFSTLERLDDRLPRSGILFLREPEILGGLLK